MVTAPFDAIVGAVQTAIAWVDNLIEKVKGLDLTPGFNLPDLNPFSAAAPAPQLSAAAHTRGAAPTATGPAAASSSTSHGALDPEAVARQIQRILGRPRPPRRRHRRDLNAAHRNRHLHRPGTAGADITCDVMAATIIHGRDNHTSQPEADTITFDIWGPVPNGLDIGSQLHVDAAMSAAGGACVHPDRRQLQPPEPAPRPAVAAAAQRRRHARRHHPYAAVVGNQLSMLNWGLTVIETGAGDGDLQFQYVGGFTPLVILRYDIDENLALEWRPGGAVFYTDFHGGGGDIISTTANIDVNDVVRVRYRGTRITIAKVTPSTDPDVEIPIADFDAPELATATFRGWHNKGGSVGVDDFSSVPHPGHHGSPVHWPGHRHRAHLGGVPGAADVPGHRRQQPLRHGTHPHRADRHARRDGRGTRQPGHRRRRHVHRCGPLRHPRGDPRHRPGKGHPTGPAGRPRGR